MLKSCRVPWSISPTNSGVTLLHSESDTEPSCSVVVGAGRLQDDNRTDSRRIELVFCLAYFARLGPHHDDESIESLGYRIVDAYQGEISDYLDWRASRWRETGICTYSGFYVATKSDWLDSLPSFFQTDYHHFVIDGRDGYVELIAKSYSWREWLWTGESQDNYTSDEEVVGRGEGVE